MNPAARSSASWHAQPARPGSITGERAAYGQPALQSAGRFDPQSDLIIDRTASPAPVSLRVRPAPAIRLLTTLALLAAAATLVYLFLSP